jgi:hypothetical protein
MRIPTGDEGNHQPLEKPILRARLTYKLRFITTIAILAVGTFGANAGVEKGKRPISARIEVTRKIPTSTLKVGNVIVKYADGTEEKWTKEGNCFLPKVSPSGVVGWVVCSLLKDGKSLEMGRDLPINGKLRIREKGTVLATVSTECEYIEDWGFTKDGRHVVIKSREAHGSADVQLFAFKNGPAEKTAPPYTDSDTGPVPDWALPYMER